MNTTTAAACQPERKLFWLLRQPGEVMCGYVVLCLQARPRCQLEENKRACSATASSCLLPASSFRANSADSVNSKRTDHTTELRAIQPPSHLPHHPTLWSCHRALGFSSLHHMANLHYIYVTYGNICVSVLSICHSFSFPTVSTSLFSKCSKVSSAAL